MQKQKDKNKDSGAMAAKKGFMGVDQLNELETIRKVAPTVVCALQASGSCQGCKGF